MLLLPLIFLFVFLPFLLLFSGTDLLGYWGARLSDRSPRVLAEALLRLPRSLLDALPVAVCCALGLLVFSTRKTSGSLFFSLALIVLSAMAVLYLGYGLLFRFSQALGGQAPAAQTPPADSRMPPPPGMVLERYLVAGRFDRLGETTVFVDAVREGRLENLVVVREEGPGPRLSHFPRADVEWRGGELRVRLPKASSSPASAALAEAQTVYAPLFRSDPASARWAADARLLSAQLESRYRRPGSSFFLLGFSLIFFLTSAFLLLRSGRWPLLGALLGFLLLRGFFFLFSLFERKVAGELRKLAPEASSWVPLLPVAIMFLAGALLLMLALLRAPDLTAKGGAGRG